MQVQPYLNFDGRCEAAIEFYRSAVGAQVQALIRFKEMPGGQPSMVPPSAENKVMHAAIRVGDSVLLCSDSQCTGAPKFEGISLSLTVADEAEAKRTFDGLAKGGEVRMPLAKTFFSPSFGMLADRFGVNWMVYVAVDQPRR
jgi:PhnB protein